MCSTSNDEQLALTVLAGRPAALAELARRFRPIFLRDVRTIGHRRLSPEATEDLVQEIFVRLLRDDMRPLRRWQPTGGRSLRWFLSWSVRQQARSAVRAQRRRDWYEVSPVGEAAGVLDPAREAEDRQLARRLLAGLPAADQHLVRMLFIDEVSAEEASQALGLSRESLYKRKQRVLERLRVLAGLTAHRPARPAGRARAA